MIDHPGTLPVRHDEASEASTMIRPLGGTKIGRSAQLQPETTGAARLTAWEW